MTHYTRIAKLNNEIEGRLLEGLLLDRDIPHALITNASSAFDGLFIPETGWGAIDGPTDRRDEILALLEEVRGGRQDAPPPPDESH